MITFLEKIYFGIYLQNIKYAVDKKMAAIKAIYFLSFLMWSNLISITCFFILFLMGTIDSLSIYFWIFFFCTSCCVVAIFFYFFYMNTKRKLSTFNTNNDNVDKYTLSLKLIANVYIAISILIDILAFVFCVKN